MKNPFRFMFNEKKQKLIEELEYTNKMIQLYHRLTISLMDCRFFAHSQEEKDLLDIQREDAFKKEREYRDRREEILDELGVCA